MEGACTGVHSAEYNSMAANRDRRLGCQGISLLVISILSLVIPIRSLLGWLGWSRLCCSVTPILLTLTLRIIRILRTWTALGRTCKTVTPTNAEQSRVGGDGRS